VGEKWLDGYDSQTTEELLALQGQYRIDSLVLAFEQGIQGKTGPIAKEERYILAVEALEREVNNGGYDQFFGNTGAEFLDVIEEALRAIGCPETAAMTRDAIAAVGLTAPIGDADLQRRLEAGDEALSAALSACDDRYYAMGEDIADQLFRWIERNSSLVRLGGA
jgi:uncharacterized protein DUF4375